ncbi:MAG TPA: homoserine O-succinyltransferase [Gemmatimonadaceae bacterium]|nr:homoserine O-succinyltransferase [Gemmatimonadaceae bacterium]
MTTLTIESESRQTVDAQVNRTADGVTYEIVGPLGAPVVAVLGGISATRHVTTTALDGRPGWWEEIVGPGRAIDTNRFLVIGIDYQSSFRGSSTVTTNEQADALASALDHARIRTLHAIVGASYGGMVALAFGAGHSVRCKKLIVISAAHESDPLATALRHLQRRVVELGSNLGRERDALTIARGIAMTSYLTPHYFKERFIDSESADSSAIENRIGSYLKTKGEDFADRWTSEKYTALSLSLDLHRVRPEDITVPTTVIAVSGDRLVPIEQSRQLVNRLAGSAQLIEIDSAFGHDAFLGDARRIAPFIEELLNVDRRVAV